MDIRLCCHDWKEKVVVANLKDDYPFLKNLYSQIKEDRELKKWYKLKIQDVYVHTYENMSNYNFYNNLLSHE